MRGMTNSRGFTVTTENQIYTACDLQLICRAKMYASHDNQLVTRCHFILYTLGLCETL